MTSPITDLLDHHLRAGHTPGAMVHVERAGQLLARPWPVASGPTPAHCCTTACAFASRR
jgi:hypothetical protein